MEPEGSLPHSQEHPTCPYPEPYRSSPRPPTPLLERYVLILPTLPTLNLAPGKCQVSTESQFSSVFSAMPT